MITVVQHNDNSSDNSSIISSFITSRYYRGSTGQKTNYIRKLFEA